MEREIHMFEVSGGPIYNKTCFSFIRMPFLCTAGWQIPIGENQRWEGQRGTRDDDDSAIVPPGSSASLPTPTPCTSSQPGSWWK